jgi:mycothiol synthase
VADLPELPEGLRARPMRPDDAAAVAAVLAAAEPVDDTGEYPDATGMSDGKVDVERDGAALCTPRGC